MIQTAELDDSFGNGIRLFCCFNFVLMILLLQAAKTILALNLNMREQKHLSKRSWSKKAVTFSVSGYLWCGGETKPSPAQPRPSKPRDYQRMQPFRLQDFPPLPAHLPRLA